MFNLTDTQVTEVLAPSKRFDREAYEAILTAVRTTGKAVGHVETEFIGVKIGHVVHMLKAIRGDAKDLSIDAHGTHGVTVIPVAAKKPAAVKPASKTPKAAKPAKGSKAPKNVKPATPAKAASGKKRTTK